MQQELIAFRTALPEDKSVVSEMMKLLYQDMGAEPGYMNDKKIEDTFNYLFSDQKNLHMDILMHGTAIAGYALLLDYWYNEFGGKVLQIDELYLHPDYRKRGIASQYLEGLSENKEYVALTLEVVPENSNACGLYKKLGFEQKDTRLMYKSKGTETI